MVGGAFRGQAVGGQRRALVAAVCDYNHDIVDYALAVASPQASGQTLVSMLIKSSSQTPKLAPLRDGSSQTGPPADAQQLTAEPSGGRSSGVQAATFNEPLSSRAQDLPTPSASGTPTLAPPLGLPSSGTGQPTLAPPRPVLPEAGMSEPRATQSGDATPTKGPGPTLRTAHKLADPDRRPVEGSTALYSALVDATPAVRAKQLTLALHWNRTLSTQAGEPVKLEPCLRGIQASDRREVIDAYWLARQRAAEYQALADQTQLLDQLVSTALARRTELGGAAAMLRLQAARVAVAAELLSAQRELLAAQFELTRRAGRPLDTAWLVPDTVPHSGTYLLRLDAQRRDLVESWHLRRLAATVPAWTADLQNRATAVVQADAARSATAAVYQAGSGTLDRVLDLTGQQIEETFAFLATLTGYNRAIADYAISVLPSSIPAEQLVETLVVMK